MTNEQDFLKGRKSAFCQMASAIIGELEADGIITIRAIRENLDTQRALVEKRIGRALQRRLGL
jgi:hypothetical protein